jgi:putative ABC transport system ATP-binding protein
MGKENDPPILELKQVWKTYEMGEEKIHALRDFTIQIHENDYMSIIGPSGSGKSTLLHMLGLLDVPTQGEVLIDQKDISGMSSDELAMVRGRKIGFVFQVFNLVPSLTALENVALPMMIQGVSKAAREKKAAEILTRLKMGDRLRHLPSELSGGQRQRVAMARALVNDPELILADEPTGNLDSKTGEEVIEMFDQLHKEGRTIVVVTHDLEVAKHADERVFIRDGTVIEWTKGHKEGGGKGQGGEYLEKSVKPEREKPAHKNR